MDMKTAASPEVARAGARGAASGPGSAEFLDALRLNATAKVMKE